MTNRRDFLKSGVATPVGVTSVLLSSNSYSNSQMSFPAGIVYTKENPGKWAKKVAGHAPIVTINANKVKIETDHSMSSKHYIVRHTIVTPDGEVLAEKTFTPTDEPISEFEIKTNHKTLIATSFCNKHDLWAEVFSI